MPLNSLTPRAVERARDAAYAVLGTVFAGTAIGVLTVGYEALLPAWAYAAVGVGGAAALFAVAVLAPRRSTEIAYDEGACAAWLHSQAFGYWAGIATFAAAGNAAALGVVELVPALFAAAMLTASSPFWHFLIGERLRARDCG